MRPEKYSRSRRQLQHQLVSFPVKCHGSPDDTLGHQFVDPPLVVRHAMAVFALRTSGRRNPALPRILDPWWNPASRQFPARGIEDEGMYVLRMQHVIQVG